MGQKMVLKITKMFYYFLKYVVDAIFTNIQKGQVESESMCIKLFDSRYENWYSKAVYLHKWLSNRQLKLDHKNSQNCQKKFNKISYYFQKGLVGSKSKCGEHFVMDRKIGIENLSNFIYDWVISSWSEGKKS